jgi:anti-anti-sigma factor
MGDDQQRREAAGIDERGVRPPAAYSILPGADPAVIVLEGELDIAAAPQLRRAIDEFSGPGLALDFRRTTFIDSAVLKELLRARAELAERGARLVLVGVPAPVRRLMDLTRTSELFERADDHDAALRLLSE